MQVRVCDAPAMHAQAAPPSGGGSLHPGLFNLALMFQSNAHPDRLAEPLDAPSGVGLGVHFCATQRAGHVEVPR